MNTPVCIVVRVCVYLLYLVYISPKNNVQYDNYRTEGGTRPVQMTVITLISVFNQLDAQNLFHSKFYFMALHVSSTCAHHQEVKMWWYQRLCNAILTSWWWAHVFETCRGMKYNLLWNKFCASSWLNTEINILRCSTVSKTSKSLHCYVTRSFSCKQHECISLYWGSLEVCGITNRFQVGKSFLLFSKVAKPASLLFNWCQWIFYMVQSSRCVNVITYTHLVSRLMEL